MIRYLTAGGTDTGIRRTCNQDSFGAKILSTRYGELAAAIMCDGMGGYSCGEVASATVVDAFQRWILRRLPLFCEGPFDADAIIGEWQGLIALCNQKIMRYGAAHGVELGTTAAMLLATQEQYLILNVGDCRVYEIGQEVRQLTTDQTLVALEVAAGKLTPEEAETDSRSHILSECIGIVPEVHPDIYRGTVRPDSVYLLCCDGFRHTLRAEDFLELSPQNMQECVQMQQQIRKLIDLNMERGETDNISAIAVHAAGVQAADSETVLITPSDPQFSVTQEFCYTDSKELAE